MKPIQHTEQGLNALTFLIRQNQFLSVRQRSGSLKPWQLTDALQQGIALYRNGDEDAREVLIENLRAWHVAWSRLIQSEYWQHWPEPISGRGHPGDPPAPDLSGMV